MGKMFRKYEDSELKKLQADMLTILAKLDDLCQKHGIEYFAIGGSLLGAIRHKGYIPWDDDMDLGMLYSDYQKFISIPEEEFEEYGLYAPEKNPGGYYSFVSKFYYKDSRFISPIAKVDGKEDMGIFVEVFPFYNVPADNGKINSIKKRIELIKALYTVACCKKVIVFDEGFKGKIKFAQKSVIKAFCKLFRLTPARLATKYDRILSKYKDEETEYIVASADVFRVYKKNWLDKYTRVPFGETTMPIPNGYKNYLKLVYGDDYMQLPPESERWNQAAEYIRFIDGTEIK